jgi:hypothetical protein
MIIRCHATSDDNDTCVFTARRERFGFGGYLAVDLALFTDVLPDPGTAAKDLGVFNIAGAVPFSIAPALAPTILATPCCTRSREPARSSERPPCFP